MTTKKLCVKIRKQIGQLESELEQFLEIGAVEYPPTEYEATKAFFEGRIYALTMVLADLED